MFATFHSPFIGSPFLGAAQFASIGRPFFVYGGVRQFGGINAFQSQIGYQSVINTGTASGINQIFSPIFIR
jgi:hypothetical protein